MRSWKKQKYPIEEAVAGAIRAITYRFIRWPRKRVEMKLKLVDTIAISIPATLFAIAAILAAMGG